MNILFDLDNTTYDLLGGLEKYYPDYSRVNQVTYSFRGIKGVIADDVYRLFADPNFFYQLQPFGGVLHTIHELFKRDNTVTFYSSCLNEDVVEAKRLRLAKDLGFTPNLICYLGDNFPDVDFDVLVDDYKEKVEPMLRKDSGLKVIMQKHAYNVGLVGRNVYYLDPLAETYSDEFFSVLKRYETIRK